MSFLTQFAQTTYDGDQYLQNANNEAAVAAALAVLLFIFVIFAIFSYVVFALLLARIFKKAGVKEWIAWVPFYNTWKTLEIGGQQGFWAVLTVVPIFNIVAAIFIYIAMYNIGLKLQKEGWFVLLGIFVPIVWYAWLAIDSSKWNEKGGPAPSKTPVKKSKVPIEN